MSDFKKFASSVKKKKFKQIYLIHGNEDYFISKAVDVLVKNAVEPDQRSFNLDIFDGSESTSEEVLSSMLSFPFVGERRLTVVKKFDKMDKKYRLDITEHLSDLPESNIACFVTGEVKISEESYKKISSIAETLTFNKLKGAELTGFLIEIAKSLDKELGARAADLLVELAGDSVGDLASELEKLSLYVSDNPKIDIDDISTLVGKSRTFNIFELQRAIGQRNAQRAQQIASKMLGTGEKPVYMNFMLTRYFLNMLQVKHLMQKGMSPDKISSSVFGRWNPFINEYTSAARGFSLSEIKNAIAVLLDVDHKLKTGGYEDTNAIVMIVSEILDKGTKTERWNSGME
ncbi:MAG: DNA polymerase III subunit delta [Bacteroidetes bacterium]|nr:DNA polymerase III subunit delta [Bacteroidota bacterium]MCL5737111.1 DNA polymerase III subunit delta [Bacteroidota bacterium]